ncbi:FUSC family protein [Actinoplanes rectilineatus]|uniref:FUSC family protein n=1 Tax=Actinoplanes rectilineatus TaxID=113571 RepID=UPI0005F28A2C|nr:FUSC family protein [Actinoplanes rectilineatus]
MRFPVPAGTAPALRAGVSVAVPQLLVLAADRPHWSMFAAFGAFTSLYGRNRVGLSRLVMQLGAGAALVVAVLLGVLTGLSGDRAWIAVGVAAVVAGLGNAVASAADWHPPGPLFLVFAFGAVASVPQEPANLLTALAVTAASAAFSILIGSLLRDRSGPAAGPKGLPVDWRTSAFCALAALTAGATATAAGIGHPYWATVAAVAPLSARGFTARLVRAGHRIGGTLLGLVLAAALLALHLDPYPAVLALAVLQVAAELTVGRHYGVAMLFITPLALVMNQVAAPRPIGGLLWDRGLETVIGGLVACLIVLGVRWLAAGPPVERTGHEPEGSADRV